MTFTKPVNQTNAMIASDIGENHSLYSRFLQRTITWIKEPTTWIGLGNGGVALFAMTEIARRIFAEEENDYELDFDFGTHFVTFVALLWPNERNIALSSLSNCARKIWILFSIFTKSNFPFEVNAADFLVHFINFLGLQAVDNRLKHLKQS